MLLKIYIVKNIKSVLFALVSLSMNANFLVYINNMEKPVKCSYCHVAENLNKIGGARQSIGSSDEHEFNSLIQTLP